MYAVSEKTDINGVYGQARKTVKMSVSGFQHQFVALSAHSFCVTPVIFNTNTVTSDLHV